MNDIFEEKIKYNDILYDLNLNTLFNAIRDKKKEFVKKILLEDPSLMKNINIDGWGAIHYCAAYGNKDIMKMLIEEFNSNINETTDDYNTPSIIAATKFNISCLIELMKHNADISLTNRSDLNVMDLLAECSHELKVIINNNIDDTMHLEFVNDNFKLVGDNTEYNIKNILFKI